MSTSVATGVLRITAEKHYFTDVLTGWAVGAAFGAVVPLVLPHWSGIGGEDATSTLIPMAYDGALRLQYTSRF